MDKEDFYNKYYSDFGTTKVSKTALKNEVLENLFIVPKKDRGANLPRISGLGTKKNAVHQADLMQLPEDKGHKYSLVVVDVASRMTDAEPLKNKEAATVLAAFKKIYSRGPLTMPIQLQVDPGTEFKGVLYKYFHDKNVFVRYGKVNRHRQQGLVERKNQQIAVPLFKRQYAQEMLTGKEDRQWIQDLPIIVKGLNRRAESQQKPVSTEIPLPTCTGDSCNLLDIGTKVRVALDGPMNMVTRKLLSGRFRSTDFRFDPTPRVIKEVLLRPGQPPMYLLDGKIGPRKTEPVAYTKNQLQIIPKNERMPPQSVLRQ